MSSLDFLEELEGLDKEFAEYDNSNRGEIGRVLIELCFHKYVQGHDFWTFWKPVPQRKPDQDSQSYNQELYIIKQELIERLRLAGCNEKPNFGVKVTPKADVLTRDTPYDKEYPAFYFATWNKVKPAYDMIKEAIKENDLPIGKIFFGRMVNKPDPYYEAQGEKGKIRKGNDDKMYWPSIKVPVEMFANEQEALAAVAEMNGDNNGATVYNWSDKAIESYTTSEQIVSQIPEIITAYGLVMKGKKSYESAPALPEKINESTVKVYLAKLYFIETSDIDQILANAPVTENELEEAF